MILGLSKFEKYLHDETTLGLSKSERVNILKVKGLKKLTAACQNAQMFIKRRVFLMQHTTYIYIYIRTSFCEPTFIESPITLYRQLLLYRNEGSPKLFLFYDMR